MKPISHCYVRGKWKWIVFDRNVMKIEARSTLRFFNEHWNNTVPRANNLHYSSRVLIVVGGRQRAVVIAIFTPNDHREGGQRLKITQSPRIYPSRFLELLFEGIFEYLWRNIRFINPLIPLLMGTRNHNLPKVYLQWTQEKATCTGKIRTRIGSRDTINSTSAPRHFNWHRNDKTPRYHNLLCSYWVLTIDESKGRINATIFQHLIRE